MALFADRSTAHFALATQLQAELDDDEWTISSRHGSLDNDDAVRQLVRFFVNQATLVGRACAEAGHGLEVVIGAVEGGVTGDVLAAALHLASDKPRRVRVLPRKRHAG